MYMGARILFLIAACFPPSHTSSLPPLRSYLILLSPAPRTLFCTVIAILSGLRASLSNHCFFQRQIEALVILLVKRVKKDDVLPKL